MYINAQEEEKLLELCQYAFDCARNNDTQALKIMLDSGLNVNISNHQGNTLLMLAAYNGNLEATKLLLEYGAEVDKQNDKRHTPLAGVCFKGYDEIARLLLEYGAKIDGGGGMGLSPINCAIMFGRGKILELFSQYGRDKMNLWQRFFSWIYGAKKYVAGKNVIRKKGVGV